MAARLLVGIVPNPYEVGKKVRQTIAELGGTMPEDLPTPKKSISQIERDLKKKELDKK